MGVYVPVVDIPGNAGSATKLANDSGSPPSYACRAWVNFNGTGTVAIRASGNVSSITDLGVGQYQVNFTTSMPDANYAAAVMALAGGWKRVEAMAAGSIQVTTYNTTNDVADTDVYVAVIR